MPGQPGEPMRARALAHSACPPKHSPGAAAAMSLARALRDSVLRHARFGVPLAAAAGVGARGFAAYLDKGAVAERVLGVVKNFDKVDPAKVGWGCVGGAG